MRKLPQILLIILPLLFFHAGMQAQNTDAEIRSGLSAITEPVLRAQLGFLASDWTEGRESDERGAYMASDYIASMLQLYGVKPGGDLIRGGYLGSQQNQERTYFQNFSLIKTSPGKEHLLRVKSQSAGTTRNAEFKYNVDFILRSLYSEADVEAPVVFVGYGFVNDKLKYNDFSKADIKGKFILKLTGSPAFARESVSAADLMAAAREAERIARESGAVGIIEVNPSAAVVGNPELKDSMNPAPSESRRTPGGTPPRYSIPAKTSSDDLIRVSVSARVAEEILKGSGISLADYQKKADANQQVVIPPLTGKSVYVKSTIETSQAAVRNVIGIIEGNNPDQIIVLGAHYDHMGIRNGYLWNGADDNASGTVGVMTMAKAIMATGKKPDKTIIVALWTAEEEGLLGSHYYVSNLLYPLKNLKLNVNFDMISRYISDDKPKGVVMTYTKSFPRFRDITIENMKNYGIDLEVDYQPSDDPPGGSDHRSFVEAGIPVMRFKPGHREEYHTPEDELSTIDWDIMEKVIKISFANVWVLANSNW